MAQFIQFVYHKGKFVQFVSVLVHLVMLVGSVTTANAGAAARTSSSTAPYLVRLESGVAIKSLLTTGDSVNNNPNGAPYRMAGVPDGLGAFDNGDHTFTLLMNHEFGATAGIERAHGGTGSFISKWIIRKGDLKVLSGEDLIQQVYLWNAGSADYVLGNNVTFARFCSANLPDFSAFYNDVTGLGYDGRLFMNGEETGSEGRAFAHAMNGDSYELPRLGKLSFENSLANPATGDKTVVIGTDDSGTGQIYIYVGEKTNSGNPVEMAGLTNGQLYSLQVAGLLRETDATNLTSANFTAYNFGDVSGLSGVELEAASNDNGVTAFNRPEDGNWDPSNSNDFYFVTTASFNGNSRLWKVHFNDPADPSAGGAVTMLLDGSEGQHMMDNMTITRDGSILIQEDPGNNAYLARIWRYDLDNGSFTPIAQHDPTLFDPFLGSASFLTQDEESSGIIDVSDLLGNGMFLFVDQVHLGSADPELVEGGQLLVMNIAPSRK